LAIPVRTILNGPYLNKDGYYVVYVEEDNGLKYVTPYHRYVWEEYHQEKVPKGCVVHHKDCNKRNNDINNLVVMTRKAHAKLHYDLRKRRRMIARRRKAALAKRKRNGN
jgi:HNH endonuclease